MNTFAPLGRASLLPPGVQAILGANVILYAVQAVGLLVPALGDLLFALGALWAPASGLFRPWQVVTYGFLHGGLLHLLFNMFALWMFGTTVERAWGTRRFVVYYAVCLVGAGLVQLGYYALTGAVGPTVGASGAVLGLLLAFGVMYPDEYVYFYFLFPIKAKYFVAGYAVLDLWSGLSGSGSGVAYFAHLGGMLAGLPLALAWRRSR